MWWDADNSTQWEKYSDAVERLGPQWRSTGNSEFRNHPVNQWGRSAQTVPLGPQSRYAVSEMSDDKYLAASPYGRFLREKLRNAQADPGTQQRYTNVGKWQDEQPEPQRPWRDLSEKEGMMAPSVYPDLRFLNTMAQGAQLPDWLIQAYLRQGGY